MRALGIAIMIAFGACGGDEPPPPKKPNATPAAPAGGAANAPQPGAGSGKPLPVWNKIEGSTQITCPAPNRDAKKCDPKAPKTVVLGKAKPAGEPDPADLSCPEPMYCLPTIEGHLCGACPERDAIRHVFKDRDFVAENNRDPFQSFIVKTPGGGPGSGDLPRDTTSRCVRTDQLRVPNYGYQDLKLVGIVAQGTRRKVLLMDPSNYGHIIKRGDCVGKEKAWVKDIGENFICFEVAQEATAAGARPPEGLCIELHTKQVAVTALPSETPAPSARPTSINVIQPPLPTLPNRGGAQGSAQPSPQQPPTNVKP
jgi:Tfp pilus assembly protein PilP